MRGRGRQGQKRHRQGGRVAPGLPLRLHAAQRREMRALAMQDALRARACARSLRARVHTCVRERRGRPTCSQGYEKDGEIPLNAPRGCANSARTCTHTTYQNVSAFFTTFFFHHYYRLLQKTAPLINFFNLGFHFQGMSCGQTHAEGLRAWAQRSQLCGATKTPATHQLTVCRSSVAFVPRQ
jgi:hypothetical protein